MKAILLYLLQVIISSGLLYGYYHLFLRNKRFHLYNRYYLLAATVISILVPFLNIPVYFSQQDEPAAWLQTLSGITSTEAPGVTGGYVAAEKTFSWQQLLIALYIVAGLFILVRFIVAIIRIKMLLRKYEVEQLGDIYFVNTEEKGTPFSFFRWMFWNNKITLQSEDGQQIFRHELFHIKQKHSWDIVFIEMFTIIFWINPFFHLIKKELKAIHEFLADQFAIKENDHWNYAELLLMHLMGTPNLRLTQPFFHNQIKRRIAMITSSQKPKYQYFRKILVLPLLALIAILFAFSYKQKQENKKEETPIIYEETLKEPSQPLIRDVILTDTPGKKSKKDVIILSADQIVFHKSPDSKETGKPSADLYIVNGKKYTKEQFQQQFTDVKFNGTVNITQRNDEEAIEKYGSQAKNGVIEIISSDIMEISADKMPLDLSMPKVDWNIIGLKDKLMQSPLYVIDGKVQPKSENNALAELNPNMIESITILKDKSATDIYGKDGENGVIAIITKLKEKLILDEKVSYYKEVIGRPLPKDKSDIQEVEKVDIRQKMEEVVVKGYPLSKDKSDVKEIEKVDTRENVELVLVKVQPIKESDKLEEVVVKEIPKNIGEKALTGPPNDKTINLKEAEHLSAIYPNPATNSVTIPYSSPITGEGEIWIVDATGKTVVTRKTSLVKGLNNVTVNVTSLTKGIYFIVVTDGKKPGRIYKLVKE